VRKKLLMGVLLGALFLVPLAGPAAAAGPAAQAEDPSGGALTAVRRVPCRNGVPYLRIWNNTGVLCFADRGSLAVNIEGVWLLNGGDNRGYVTYTRDGRRFTSVAVERNQPLSFSPEVRIVKIVIY
jgi:hypothetical protein